MKRPEVDVPKGITEAMALRVVEAYRYRCAESGPFCDGRLHLHHIKYKSRGGSDRAENLVLLCRKHHDDEHQGRGNGWSLSRLENEPDRLPMRSGWGQ